MDFPAAQRCELSRAVAFILHEPKLVLQHIRQKFYAFWGPNSYVIGSVHSGLYTGGPLARSSYERVKWVSIGSYVLVILGSILAVGRRPVPPRLQWLLLLTLYYVGMHLLAVAASRYRLPWMPIGVILAAQWLAHPAPPQGRIRKLAVALLLGGFSALAGHYVVNVLP
ncbi:MAG: hypothetical protein ACE5FG_00735 [Myxococcota bacterium]